MVKHPVLVSEIPDSLAFGTGWMKMSQSWHGRSWQFHPSGRGVLHEWGFAVIPSHFQPEMLSLLPPPRDTQGCCSWIKELQLRGFSQKQIQLLTSVRSRFCLDPRPAAPRGSWCLLPLILTAASSEKNPFSSQKIPLLLMFFSPLIFIYLLRESSPLE